MAKTEVNTIRFEGLNYKGVNISGMVTITNNYLVWKFNDLKAFNMVFKEEKLKGVPVMQVGRSAGYVEKCEGKTKEQLTEELKNRFALRGIKTK